MAKFKVGDAVRVKAGSPAMRCGERGEGIDVAGVAPRHRAFGKRLEISKRLEITKESQKNCAGGRYFSVDIDGGGRDYITENYLEPWNDAEEWNGTAWVAKKPADSPKPAIVCLREEGKLNFGIRSTECKSTNAAFALAETWANDSPGKEYVVLQEKGSRRVEKYPVFQRGDVMQAARNTQCQVMAIKVSKGTCLVVNYTGNDMDSFFNAWVGDSTGCLKKADFVKVGRVEL